MGELYTKLFPTLSPKRKLASGVKAPQKADELAAQSTANPVRYFNRTFWIVLGLSLFLHLALCQFFTFGDMVPASNDMNPCNLWRNSYMYPPLDRFIYLSILGSPLPAPALDYFSFWADLPAWFFFTAYPPVTAALALVTMYMLLKELNISPPAALFGAVAFAWQGDIIPFVLPGHYFYMSLWFTIALSIWAALRAMRTGYWPYPILSGLCCGWIVQCNPDRGTLASLMVAAIYLSGGLIALYEARGRESVGNQVKAFLKPILKLAICTVIALIVASGSLFALFDNFINDVSIGVAQTRQQAFEASTEFRLGVTETLSLAVPGYFGWISTNAIPQDQSPEARPAPYWGENGRSANYLKNTTHGMRNFNNAISTIGTLPSAFAVLGIFLVVFGERLQFNSLAKNCFSSRQIAFGRAFAAISVIALILSWGANTPVYQYLFQLPLMDKWRNPLKWLEDCTFCLCILSAYGMEFSITSLTFKGLRQRSLRFYLRCFYWTAIGLLGWGLMYSYPLGNEMQAFGDGKPTPYLYKLQFEPHQILDILYDMHLSMGVAFFLMSFFALVVELLWHPDLLRNRDWVENPLIKEAWQTALSFKYLPNTLAMSGVFFTVIQLFWVDAHFILPVKIHALTASNKLLDALVAKGPTTRVCVATGDSLLRNYTQFQFLELGIPCLQVQAISRIPNDLRDFQYALKDNEQRYNFLAGASCIVIPAYGMDALAQDPQYRLDIDGKPEGYSIVPTQDGSPSHAIVNLKYYLQKATWVPFTELLPDQKSLIARLGDKTWIPYETVLFNKQDPNSPKIDPFPPQPLPGATKPEIELTMYNEYQIRMHINHSRPGYILVNDAFWEGWHAVVNSQPVPIYRANIMLRAVPITVTTPDVDIWLYYDKEYPLPGGRVIRALRLNQFCDGSSVLLSMVVLIALLRRRKLNRAKHSLKSK